jgi:DNA-binding MarR family transcriptional regulator
MTETIHDETADPAGKPDGAGDGFGLLLVQLGFHVAARFNDAIAPLGVEPRHVGTLRRLATREGQSQQAFADQLGIHPNRVVFLVDELEERGLIERRRSPADRRTNALYLTGRGHQLAQQAAVATAEYSATLGHSLSPNQRRQLKRLLQLLADEQGINPQGLPGPPPQAPIAQPTR